MTWVSTLLLGCHDQPFPVPADLPAGTDPGSSETLTPGGLPVFRPAPATLYRLTDQEWRNSVQDLLGVAYTGALPVDYALYNYDRVGGSELTIGPLDLEMYETGAWTAAELAVPSLDAAEVLLGCPSDDAAASGRGSRPPPRGPGAAAGTEELDELAAMRAGVTVDPLLALQAVVASVLLSPDFLFRVEVGEPDPDHPDWRRYSSYEMAGRMASFLTASVPDFGADARRRSGRAARSGGAPRPDRPAPRDAAGAGGDVGVLRRDRRARGARGRHEGHHNLPGVHRRAPRRDGGRAPPAVRRRGARLRREPRRAPHHLDLVRRAGARRALRVPGHHRPGHEGDAAGRRPARRASSGGRRSSRSSRTTRAPARRSAGSGSAPS